MAASSKETGAREEIAQFVATGRLRPLPRSWTTGVKPAPGVAFLYSAAFPGVCGIVYDGALVTFVTREFCRTSSARRTSVRPSRRPSRQGRSRRNARSDRDTRSVLHAAQSAFVGRTSPLGWIEDVAA